MAIHIRRRELIVALGSATAVWPLVTRAQQMATPVVGFLNTRARSDDPQLFAAFHQGLKEAGYIEGQNVAIEYRFAENQYDRLPALAADLVHRQPAVIFANGPAAVVAKAATTTIPIVFFTALDPVAVGIVASLNHPGGNVTGVTTLGVEVGSKRLELLHELIPTAIIVAALVNPDYAVAETQSKDLRAAARILGLEMHILNASSERDFDTAFAALVQLRAGALVISADPFFTSRSEQLAALTVRDAVPTIFQYREFAAAGGLMSYGTSNVEAYRLTGVYTGRILKGEKPADLPVQQATKVELFLNLKTAKALGITVPITLLGRADEVIE
jgi:putative ABC transport system substrate-binding protein